MTDPADLAREACTLLAGYLPVLERLLAEPVSAPGAAAGMTPRAADAPEPWDGQAARALMDAHEGVRRLEAGIHYGLNGHPGLRRGGSAGNTREALKAIPKLAAGLDRDGEAAVVRILERWITEARSLPAIDEARQWRPLPSRACPYCGCWFLRGDMDARPVIITCFVPGCADGNGLRPAATMGTDEHGRPVLAWADGRVETVLELEG
jgi:hypothetical protein